MAWFRTLAIFVRASGLAAEMLAGSVPLSGPARAAGPDWLVTCLTGGDDYELAAGRAARPFRARCGMQPDAWHCGYPDRTLPFRSA